MRRARRLVIAALLGLVLALPAALPLPARAGTPGDFDYYALVLSWSPTYCATPEGNRDRHQCGGQRAYAFVVHGLWPQYERGWPDNCAAERWVPEHVIDAIMGVMPSKRLVIHEWRKHGTCSGLDPAGYFALTRKLFDTIRIPARYLSPQETVSTTPDGLMRDFLKTNPKLEPDMITVHCGNRRDRARLSDIRICFTPDGTLTSCGPNERRACRARELVLPPVR